MPGGLRTDLYELNMAVSYLRRGMTGPSTFSLYVRKLPKNRGFLVAAGIAVLAFVIAVCAIRVRRADLAGNPIPETAGS